MPLLLTLLLGCGPGSSEPDGTAKPHVQPDIVMGTGEWDWEPIEDGQEIDVIQGPQGGFHLLGCVRVAGITAGNADDLSAADNPTTTFWVIHEGVDLSPASVFVQGLDPSPADVSPFSHQMVGRFVIMNIEADDELDGVDIVFGVSVEDVDGVRVETEMNLTAVPHPLNL